MPFFMPMHCLSHAERCLRSDWTSDSRLLTWALFTLFRHAIAKSVQWHWVERRSYPPPGDGSYNSEPPAAFPGSGGHRGGGGGYSGGGSSGGGGGYRGGGGGGNSGGGGWRGGNGNFNGGGDRRPDKRGRY